MVGLLVLSLSGCVGFGQRESTELFPADSLSRQLAEATPVDSVEAIWERDSLGTDSEWAYVNTVQFGPDGLLYASDVVQNRLYVFDEDGGWVRTVDSETFAYPYLIGSRGDTLGVMNAGSGTVDLLVDDRVMRTVPLPATTAGDALSFYAAYTEAGLFFKENPDVGTRFVTRLDAEGEQVTLPGPAWRHRGILRTWGDSLISLSAHRPVIDVIAPDGRLDTLALMGFDSPMLARSRSFVLGELSSRDDPPQLITSAVAVDDRLFVLNVRPGWVQVDVYGEDGRVQDILVERQPEATGYNNLDLAVRRRDDGSYDIVVARLLMNFRMLSADYGARISWFVHRAS